MLLHAHGELLAWQYQYRRAWQYQYRGLRRLVYQFITSQQIRDIDSMLFQC